MNSSRRVISFHHVVYIVQVQYTGARAFAGAPTPRPFV